MMSTKDDPTEVLVIGGGPGGYVAAIRAGQLGLDTTLIEMDGVGGTCLNHGCIPSKAILTAGEIIQDAQNSQEMGIYGDMSVEFGELIDWKDEVVNRLTGGVESLCHANGVKIIDGRAEFVNEHRVAVYNSPEDDDPSEIEFENAIIATGSRPIQLPGFDYADDPVIDSRQALGLTSAPNSLLVIGAGYIGMELSSAFAKLGTDVTVIEMLESTLPGYADDLTEPVRKRSEAMGIDFYFNRVAEEWHYSGYDGISVKTSSRGVGDPEAQTEDADVQQFDTDKVLVSVGRQPVTDTLSLDEVGIETTEKGFIKTDEFLQTAETNIFAIGDVAGEPMLAHKASREGELVAEYIVSNTNEKSSGVVPAAVFTEPEIATVGHTVDSAEENGYEPIVGQFPFSASGRSLTTNNNEGFVRIVADGETNKVLGAQIVGPEASELIAELTLAIEMDATLKDIGTTVHTHPTLAESVMEAAENALGKAIHISN